MQRTHKISNSQEKDANNFIVVAQDSVHACYPMMSMQIGGELQQYLRVRAASLHNVRKYGDGNSQSAGKTDNFNKKELFRV